MADSTGHRHRQPLRQRRRHRHHPWPNRPEEITRATGQEPSPISPSSSSSTKNPQPFRDRFRKSQGQSPRPGHRHPNLRQGLRPGNHPPRPGQRKTQTHRRLLLLTQRPPGPSQEAPPTGASSAQVLVPLDETGESQVISLFRQSEKIRRPAATMRSTTQPTTQPTDPQLQTAVNTMIGLIVVPTTKTAAPTTTPTTRGSSTGPTPQESAHDCR